MRTPLIVLLFVLVSTINSGCSRFFGPEEAPAEAPTSTSVAVPTFTPTSESPDLPATALPTASKATPAVTVAETAQAEATQAPVTLATVMAADTENSGATSTLSLTPTLVSTPTSEDAAAAGTSDPSESYVVVAAEIINVRSGPGTEYDIIGSVTAGQQLPTTGRNEGGDWWQVCCFEADQPGWLYGALLDVQNGERVAVASDIPSAPAPTATQAPAAVTVAEEPTAEEPTAEEPVAEESVAEEPVAEATAPAEVQPAAYSETAGNFDPNAQFQIVHYHVRGYDENNGGIFNNGGQHMIFITVLDENGAGIDGAVVKDALADTFSIVTGSKGPGKAEFEMFWEPYKLYVASIPSGPVTSQVSNQMNTAKPHIPDIVGKLGPPENEYAICPTVDDRCEPPFFHAHWSYEITFQKVK